MFFIFNILFIATIAVALFNLFHSARDLFSSLSRSRSLGAEQSGFDAHHQAHEEATRQAAEAHRQAHNMHMHAHDTAVNMHNHAHNTAHDMHLNDHFSAHNMAMDHSFMNMHNMF